MLKTLLEKNKAKMAKFGVYLMLFFVAILAISLVKNINRVGRIRRQVEAERASLAKMVRENEALEAEVAKTKTADFLEKEVRNKLGLAKEGESIVVLPEAEILRKLAPKIETENVSLPDPIWKRWLRLLI